jgi:hypothetical protein
LQSLIFAFFEGKFQGVKERSPNPTGQRRIGGDLIRDPEVRYGGGVGEVMKGFFFHGRGE